MPPIPVIDIGPLVHGAADRARVGAEIGAACRAHGFFSVRGHGVDPGLQRDLERHTREFFAQPLDAKLAVAMARGGPAWRGYFPPGGELTSGVPDLKEGYYFGAELPADHPRVLAGTPLHGPNLFPDHPAGLRQTVLDYLAALTRLGHTLMTGVALSLGLDETYFADRYTADPLVLFRAFNYPAQPPGTPGWGVGEHTDYGLLTILKQDHHGGLQVRTAAGWVDAEPIPDTFVCNIGDMLDRLTGGRYRSTPHRVRPGPHDRLSWPFFFDPAFDADVSPVADAVLADSVPADDGAARWDGASVHEFRGTYGDYLLGKVGKVFPALHRQVL
ncbi:isopenicillin N synthase family dioxygenase [Actinokineospora sp.]|uniref:isopenicillin N synthase family dioxygenase n=1 Tax=Actinokineospora sp. TaxID=1872133 RepID=UPI004037F9B9